YAGSASMSFAVPDANSAAGAYAGGVFYTTMPRDLSGYNALTFYIKASQAASIDLLGFGNDFGVNKYQTTLSGVAVNNNWRKVIIPIPDDSKLTAEKGMLLFSEGAENEKGYTFWIDEVKFEKLGTIGHGKSAIMNAADKVTTSFVGVKNTVNGLLSTFSLPDGTTQTVNLTSAYFTFASSNPAVATVDALGNVNTVGTGQAIITGTLGGSKSIGSLTVNSSGAFLHAPTPTRDPSKVISLYTEAYPNVTVDYYNGYWAPYQTTQSADFTVNGDNVLNYTNFNFVGIQFSAPTINASSMSHLHLDLYLPNTVVAGTNFKVKVADFGADGVFGGTDDTSHTLTYTAPTLAAQKWISLDIPFTSLSGLTSRNHLAQVVFEGTNISNFYADNIYFYNDGSIIPSVPTTAAPTPTYPPANVTSIFSDAYTNVAGTDLNPNWGQTTAVSQVSIAGNNTLKYAGLNYQGLVFGSAQNVTTKTVLHLDYYTANSSALKVYLISPGPVEKASTLVVPSSSGINTAGWKSIDIPLSSFSPVVLSNLIQMKFDGNGDIYLDNIYFR
ncbi:MAG: hypothetical protein EOO88_39745, partial [Pedobacter sp.]